MGINLKKIYQNLYATTDYGDASKNKCPGVRFFPLYKDWLKPNVMDVGCGSGDTVRLMRANGIKADGIDWINLNNDMMVRDITDDLNFTGYKTATCLDVLEHLTEQGVYDVLYNLKKCERQVITVHSGPSKFGGNIELHTIQWSLKRWESLIKEYFIIKKAYTLQPLVRKLFICEAPPLSNKIYY